MHPSIQSKHLYNIISVHHPCVPRNWYPSRAPKELAIEERRLLVEMAVEACVVQLLVTGFVHADPHEGNLRRAVTFPLLMD
jgi:hypothetical protein